FKINQWQGKRLRRRDDLDCLVISQGKGGAQALMPPQHFMQTLHQGGQIQTPMQSSRRTNQVSSITGLKLVEEPETLLGEREWQRTGALLRQQRRAQVLQVACQRQLDSAGQPGNSRRVKQG